MQTVRRLHSQHGARAGPEGVSPLSKELLVGTQGVRVKVLAGTRALSLGLVSERITVFTVDFFHPRVTLAA